MNSMEQYIQTKAHSKFSWRYNNCIHFVCEFHDIEFKFENGMNLREFLPEFEQGIAEHGFQETDLKLSGNICAVNRDGSITMGLRYLPNDNWIAFQAAHGIRLEQRDTIIKEWK